ncbi:MAG: 3-hydroxyacyl-ACP dehydratase FabZ [Gammaproteobacteria bacterium]|nr:3-hydroxyacyl-ACP dehydratase FabZ [Gammaproteobacteria bacterium]MDD9874380.1 3-hydroxyacyl-ACP dehydratase FabZ [Gammaproteobacteria bacterium]
MTQASRIDIHRIRDILPHRYPFLLIDRVLDYELHTRLSAVKNVSVNEPFFQGHFPSHPVFPGVLILEAIAQASAILASCGLNEAPGDNILFLFAGIDRARFKHPVEPGDRLLIEVEEIYRKSRIWKYTGKASVDGRLAATADILFTYRIL